MGWGLSNEGEKETKGDFYGPPRQRKGHWVSVSLPAEILEIGHVIRVRSHTNTHKHPSTPLRSPQLVFPQMHNFLIRPTLAAARRAIAQRAATRPYVTKPPNPEVPDYDSVDPVPDYPELPWVSRQNLPAKGWDDMLLRRNYGDTVQLTPFLTIHVH